ncbi:hypothetical protein OSB04_026256 [Centaurea solstitialis]|uniref:Probable quinone oxidoreductase n=1 Tax=Centaurea solstitialis TaxID=347529 RepID=A0AA38W5R2_9ASTR|nr:hypothetical protein OSB04_026256 [Centaurea solstitialis]
MGLQMDPTHATMVKAIRVHEHGGPEVFKYEDVEVGEPKEGEIKLKHKAIGINFCDVYMRRDELGISPPLPYIPGLEGAGVVTAVGAGVTTCKIGDLVAYAVLDVGSYADERIIRADQAVPVPSHIDPVVAASVIFKGLTALVCVRNCFKLLTNRPLVRANTFLKDSDIIMSSFSALINFVYVLIRQVERGHTVLVHAAAGGVGSLICQWANAVGATVIGTVSTKEKAVQAKEDGCHHVILYKDEIFVDRVMEITSGKGVDGVYDSVGKDTFNGSLACLKPRGFMCNFGTASGVPDPIAISQISRKSLFYTFPGLPDYTDDREELLAAAEELFSKVAKGVLRVRVNRYPLSQAGQAHADLQSRKTMGSIVLIPDDVEPSVAPSGITTVSPCGFMGFAGYVAILPMRDSHAALVNRLCLDYILGNLEHKLKIRLSETKSGHKMRTRGFEPEVLKWEDVEVGEPKEGEIKLKHKAIGINFCDVYMRKNWFQLSPPLPYTPGLEGAGIVTAIGAGVTHCKVGDLVAYAMLDVGSYAEERILPAHRAVPVPSYIDPVVAASVIFKGLTARMLVRHCFKVERGHTILVHAAAGGVGSLVCQWANAIGATVIGTVSTKEKAMQAKEDGCHHVILNKDEIFVDRVMEITAGKGVDVVYDSIGKDTFLGSLACLKPRGLMCQVGLASGEPEPITLGQIASKSLYYTFPQLEAYTNDQDELIAAAQELFSEVAKGVLRVRVNHKYPLSQAVQAHADLESRKTMGSVVLIPDDE